MGALRNIKNAIQNVQSSAKKAKDVVLQQEKQILQEFFVKLKHNTAVLLEQVDSKHDDVYQKLAKQYTDMKAYVDGVNGSLEFARNIVENGGKEEILSLGKDIEMHAKEIVKECPESLRPVHYGCLKYERANSPKDIVENRVDLSDLGNIVDDPIQSLLDNSTILDGNFEHAKQLVEWVDDHKFTWQLCYRASRDGWKGEDFHRKCDEVGPTVTLVKCGINVFGGFTDQSWKKAQASPQTFKHSDVSFLFSLRNKDNLKPFKCPIEVHANEKAIWCYPGFGATFGGFRDLHISGNANTTQNSLSYLGSTYQPPSGYHYGSPQTKALLAGSHRFQPTSIEVFRR
ncbi:uncharacterized protein LOC114516827 [Dendronephthya gigantea]|uniref:uncharacterized protein LOC114516827 n=1 Tax=Dendronephthya gigantea TaxID=151771 RepID=UPI00106D8E37|nr:uncharacterized protein LOC114516827 [Dendronephthya gigantea]